MRITLTVILYLVVSLSISFAQEVTQLKDLDKKSQKKYEKALKCLKKDQKKGTKNLEEVILKYPDFLEGRKKLAEHYYKNDQKELSLKHLEATIELGDDDPKLLMTLSDFYEEDDDFPNAISTIEKLQASPQLKDKQKTIVARRLEELKFRKLAYENPVPFEAVALGSEINTLESEYLPAFNADGSVMIYTSRNDGSAKMANIHEDLYVAEIVDGQISQGQPIEELNTVQNEGAHTFSQDGKILIFTSCDRRNSTGGCDLYISFLKDEGWSEPQNMGNKINSRFWESQPVLSADNKTLYFSSKRTGGLGGSDIWKVELGKIGWGNPINMGDKINTPGNEASPFIHADNKSFYFRSDGHIGLGGYDIFLSRFENDEWQMPKNLGYPINSKGSEGALFVELNGQKAYYASDAQTAGEHLDILHFDLPEALKPNTVSYLKLSTGDLENKAPLSADITLTNINDPNDVQSFKTDLNGQLLTIINTGSYALTVSKEGYLFHSENMALEESKTAAEPFLYSVLLQKIKPKEVVVTKPKAVILKNIFFETGSATLLSSSDIEINKLFELLNTNPNIKIQIIGHTDNVGNENDNQKLSEERARSVYTALVNLGVEKSRVSSIGKGENNPIASNEDEAGRKENRRTEFVIVN